MTESFDALVYQVDVIDEQHSTPYISKAVTNLHGVGTIAKAVGVDFDDREKFDTALVVHGSAEAVGVAVFDGKQFRIFARLLPKLEAKQD